MLEFILNLIYPKSCGMCNKISEDYICKKCETKLKRYILSRRAAHKGVRSKFFDNLISLYKYEENIRQRLIEYKFGDKSYLYKFFSKIILKNEKTFGLFKNNYDIIIPVPIYKKKKQSRGYNQTELIAKEIAKQFDNLEYEDNILLKIRSTVSQSVLSKNERKINVNNVFDIDNKYIEKIQDKKIILFDDVYTTGSTVNECSRILKSNGAKEVIVLTIAKD